MDIPILYEDQDYLVIDKPAGIIAHADGRNKQETLTDWILEKYPEIKGVGEPLKLSDGSIIDRPGIVHRIDRETSGVLAIAKNQDAFHALKFQFQDREVEKTYHAFLYGEIKQEEGIIDRPIARSKKDFRLWSAQRGSRGELRDAITEYTVLAKTADKKPDESFSYVEAKPKTGRTHQIRVHFKAINHPVVGDSLYAPKRQEALGFKRLALHARSISFANLEGNKITVEAPFPEDFIRARQALGVR